MIRGFNDTCEEAETKITGGQTIKNPNPIIGGVANSLCRAEEFITPTGSQPGDVLVLTKPIGT
jgi:selenide,water dikinase